MFLIQTFTKMTYYRAEGSGFSWSASGRLVGLCKSHSHAYWYYVYIFQKVVNKAFSCVCLSGPMSNYLNDLICHLLLPFDTTHRSVLDKSPILSDPSSSKLRFNRSIIVSFCVTVTTFFFFLFVTTVSHWCRNSSECGASVWTVQMITTDTLSTLTAMSPAQKNTECCCGAVVETSQWSICRKEMDTQSCWAG